MTNMIVGRGALLKSDAQTLVHLQNRDERTILDPANLVIELIDSDTGTTPEPLPPGDPQVRKPDITNARTELGWDPTVSLGDGLERSIEYFETVVE